MKRKIFLHIGLHKTGTTSIQYFFHRNINFYRERGLQFYICELGTVSANGIAPLILRDGVLSASPKQIDITKRHLKRFLDATEGFDVLISGEALSYLRTDEECIRLKELLSAQDNHLVIILTLRDKEDFWRSYTNQVKKAGKYGNKVRDSAYFLDKNGWLTDFDTLTTVLRTNFDDVKILEYQENMVRHFCESMQFPIPSNFEELRLNRRYPRIRAEIRGLYVRYLVNTWIGALKRRIFPKPM